MKMHHVTIAIILVSIIALGAMTFISDIGDKYSATSNLTALNRTRARLEEQQESAQELSDDITTFKLEGPLDYVAFLYKPFQVAWKAAKITFRSWITVGTIATETGDELARSGVPLPDYLVPSLISILIITLVFIIVYAFFKWRMTD
jgi:hypothetical protein